MLRRLIAVLLPALFSLSLACTPSGAQRHESIPSKPEVASTLDANTQRIAREEIDRAVVEWRPAAAVVVVLDSATGAVLAMEGRDRGRDDPKLALRRPYVTGSTLKSLTIAAALDAGTIDLDAHVDCATRPFGNGKIYDPVEHGSLSISDVLAVSSNVGTSRVYDTLGLDRLVAALHRFHIGDPPAQLPVVTDGASARAVRLSVGELAEATPMQVAAGYAAIVNGGVYVAPTFSRASKLVPERVVRPETAHTMVTMLEGAVTSDRGSGKLARVDGVRVAGKTGTGELANDRTYASFVGTILDRPSPLVILVGLEEPNRDGSGPSAAAPTFARIAKRLSISR